MSDIVLPGDKIENIELEYMIFTLCNGDITRKKYIEDNYDVQDYVEWTSFKQFDSYQEAEMNKRYQDGKK